MKLISNVEFELEEMITHIREILSKNPNADIHINPPDPSKTITVGGPHPASATPTGHKPK